MVRMLVSILFEILANAVGLVITAWVVPGFRIDVTSFIIVLLIFTAVKFVLSPLITQLSFQYARAIFGGVALVTTFLGLWITSLFSSGLVVDGVWTWILATLIVWLCGVLAIILLPMFLFKRVMSDVRQNRAPPPAV